MDAVSEEDMNILSKAIFKNSAPEIDENIRFAVAQSLTLLDDVLQCKWQNNNPIFIQRQQQVLNRYYVRRDLFLSVFFFYLSTSKMNICLLLAVNNQ